MEKSNNIIDLTQNKSEDYTDKFQTIEKALDNVKVYGPPKPDKCKKILFYEWSDYQSKPLEFTDFSEFVAFMIECNIFFNTEERVKVYNKSQETGGVHVMCSKDGKKLFIEATNWGIKYESEKYDKNVSNESTVQSSSTDQRNTQPYHHSCTPPRAPMYCRELTLYDDDEYYGYYD